ncbi:MAG: hypothetical protein R3255_04540 [Candidatus Lokiarchaeia archaeon]|nr:hypothetical protein [Candidatus Lokiarchaeia archaeon]
MLNIIIGIFQIIWILLFIGFWTVFYFTEYKKPKMSEVEWKHELSFPFPDLGWIVPTLIVAAIGVLLEQNYGFFFSALAGSGMMFLGIIDLAFNLQNNKFNREKHGFDAIVNIGVVVLTLIFAPIFILYGAFGLGI